MTNYIRLEVALYRINKRPEEIREFVQKCLLEHYSVQNYCDVEVEIIEHTGGCDVTCTNY